MPRVSEHIGKRSGYLIVVSRASNDPKGGTQWNCQCDCGNQVVVRGQYLVEAKSGYQQKYCSHQCKLRLASIRIDLAGRKFGRLIALQAVGSNSNGETLWQFQCSCGALPVCSGVSVVRGHTQSCGCLHRENHFKHGKSDTAEYRTSRTRKWRENHPEKAHAFSGRSAKARALRTPKWLTTEHLLQMGEFYRTANKLTEETGVAHHVDHIFPLQGKKSSGLHVPWNLRVTTAALNRAKSNRHPTSEEIVRSVQRCTEVEDKEPQR